MSPTAHPRMCWPRARRRASPFCPGIPWPPAATLRWQCARQSRAPTQRDASPSRDRLAACPLARHGANSRHVFDGASRRDHRKCGSPPFLHAYAPLQQHHHADAARRLVDFPQPGAKAQRDHAAALEPAGAELMGAASDRATSRLRTAQPVRWPRSSARITVAVGLPPASTSIGTGTVTLASTLSPDQSLGSHDRPHLRVVVVRMAAGNCQERRRHPPSAGPASRRVGRSAPAHPDACCFDAIVFAQRAETVGVGDCVIVEARTGRLCCSRRRR